MSVNTPSSTSQANEAAKKQEIAKLGDGEVFVKRSANGIIRAVQGFINLDEKNGEIADIQGKFMTTSKGFNNLNQIAGLSIITPEKLTLPEGNSVVNPYPIVDPESGSISKVWVKKVAIGFSPIGNLVVTSATLLYDIRMYFIQDIVKKVNENKNAGKIISESALTDQDKKDGEFFRIDGKLGVLVYFSNADILKALNTFIQKKLFGERNAQSVCERLVMGKHPALSHAVYVDATGLNKAHAAKVPVIGYVHEFTREEMINIAGQAEKGEEIKVGGKPVETIDAGITTATTEDMVTESDTEEEHEAPEQTSTTGQSEPGPQPSLFKGDRY